MRSATSLLLAALTVAATVYAEDVPPGNRADLSAPPPMPSAGDLESKMARLWEAIRTGDPERAEGVFLPRAAFAPIKAVPNPDPLWERLHRAFERDVRVLHDRLPPGAEFVRFERSRRRGWVPVGEEANRLPYWSERHDHLVLRSASGEARIEVRTLIAWGDEWFVTHLSEFR